MIETLGEAWLDIEPVESWMVFVRSYACQRLVEPGVYLSEHHVVEREVLDSGKIPVLIERGALVL